MHLAHLRGLLLPYYSQGARSVIAESAMLNALASTITADLERSLLIAEAAFAPLLTPEGAQATYAATTGGFANVLDRAMLEVVRTPQKARANAQGLIALMQALEKSGFFEKVNRETEKALREAGWERD